MMDDTQKTKKKWRFRKTEMSSLFYKILLKFKLKNQYVKKYFAILSTLGIKRGNCQVENRVEW